jgi:hypothetical protein
VINGTYGVPEIENNLENSEKNNQHTKMLKDLFMCSQAQWDDVSSQFFFAVAAWWTPVVQQIFFLLRTKIYIYIYIYICF